MLPIDVKPLVYYPLSQLMPATLHGVLVTLSPEDVPTFKEKLLMDGSPSTPIMTSALGAAQKQPVLFRLLFCGSLCRSITGVFKLFLRNGLLKS
jgi:hypothetical protein